MVARGRIHEVKRGVQVGLLLIPGVHSVGVGPKLVGGKSTGELAIKVYLVKKKPPSQVSAAHLIPREIDGFKTVVVEMPVPSLHSGTPDTSKERPLLGGVRIMTKHAPEWGTLGFFAHTADAPPKLVAVTCQHVVAPPQANKPSELKAHLAGGPPDPFTIIFSGTENTPGSLIVVKMGSASEQKEFNAYVTTADTDIPTVATSVRDAVNSIPGAGVTAAISAQSDEQVVITVNLGADTIVAECTVYDPMIPDPSSKLFADVSVNTITLSGVVAGDYAVYTSTTAGV